MRLRPRLHSENSDCCGGPADGNWTYCEPAGACCPLGLPSQEKPEAEAVADPIEESCRAGPPRGAVHVEGDGCVGRTPAVRDSCCSSSARRLELRCDMRLSNSHLFAGALKWVRVNLEQNLAIEMFCLCQELRAVLSKGTSQMAIMLADSAESPTTGRATALLNVASRDA